MGRHGEMLDALGADNPVLLLLSSLPFFCFPFPRCISLIVPRGSRSEKGTIIFELTANHEVAGYH